MLSTIPPDRLRDAGWLVSISVDQYERMLRTGILPEGAPIELIDGMLVLKDRSKAGDDIMTIGSEHVWSVKAVGRTDERLRPLGCHMQTQSPVIISGVAEPEPDGAVLLGTADDYLREKPTAQHMTCVIEVSDSSLNYDRTTKLRAYAQAQIRQYIIVNLVDGIIEEHTAPDSIRGTYTQTRNVLPGQRLALFLPGDERLDISAADWLPPGR